MDEIIKQMASDFREQLERLYGGRLRCLVVFGSQARSDAEPGSDLDVLVVLEGPVSPGEEILRTSEIRSELSLKYEEVVSCVYVSADRYLHEQSPLLINVRREGLRL